MKKEKYHPCYWNNVPNEWKETIDRMYLEGYTNGDYILLGELFETIEHSLVF